MKKVDPVNDHAFQIFNGAQFCNLVLKWLSGGCDYRTKVRVCGVSDNDNGAQCNSFRDWSFVLL
jgi:hypothetical protein